MNFVRILSLLLACLVAPFMLASAPADIEQAYKTEKAKVDKTVKDKKTKAGKVKQEKKSKLQEWKEKRAETAKAKAAKAKAAKTAKTTKPTKVHKAKAPATIDKTAKTTKLDKTPKATKDIKKEAKPVEKEKVTHRTPDIKTLEPMTVIKGEEFMIKRPASPNFGRTWKLHKTLPLQIEQVGKAKFVPAEHPGKNEGTMVFTFKGIKPGVTQIEFEKVYPPELRDKKPAKIRMIPVEIKEAGSK